MFLTVFWIRIQFFLNVMLNVIFFPEKTYNILSEILNIDTFDAETGSKKIYYLF